MLAKEDFMVIQALAKRGVYQRDIAQTVGVHPKTVQRALNRGGAPPPRPKRRPSLLDAYRAEVDRLLAEGVWNGVVIFRELQAQGYQGGLSILRDYLRPKRALRPGRATVRFETAPGQQLQCDWGQIETVIGGAATVVHFLVNTLGYSRRFHFWGTTCEDAEHTYEGLIRSFEWFDGVVAEVLVDNQKCAVVAHPRTGATFNPRFVDLAERYGFVPRACRPARARTKGKDERMVGYVKHHFFVRYRAFDSWDQLNLQAEQWLREEADPRVPRDRARGRGGPVCSGGPHAAAAPGPTLRHLLLGESAGQLGQLYRGPREPLQRPGHPGRPAGHGAGHARRRGPHLRWRAPRSRASAAAGFPGLGDGVGAPHRALAPDLRGRTPAPQCL